MILMLWVFLSIFAVILWASSNLIDKYVLDKYVRQPFIYIIILGAAGLIFSIFVFAKNFVWVSFTNLILTFAAGFLYIAILICYFKALKIEEASRIIPLFELKGIFILILAAIFLGEILTPIKYFGVFLLVGGAILISIKKNFKLRNTKAFWLMLLASILLASYDVLTKYLLNFADYWTIFAYTRFGSFIFILPFIYFYLPELKRTIQVHGKRVLGLMTTSEALNMFGVLSITAAMSFGLISLVGGLGATQPFFVLLLAAMLSIFYPKILKEEIKGSIILLKLVAVALIIVGTLLII